MKKDKSLSLKEASRNRSDEEEDMAYITRRFQKFVRKHRCFRKGGISGKDATANDLCQKCGKPEHFIIDCLMIKAENTRLGGDKNRRRDLIPEKKGTTSSFKRTIINNIDKFKISGCMKLIKNII